MVTGAQVADLVYCTTAHIELSTLFLLLIINNLSYGNRDLLKPLTMRLQKECVFTARQLAIVICKHSWHANIDVQHCRCWTSTTSSMAPYRKANITLVLQRSLAHIASV
eukprot:1901881-Amphidinium_carterae.1